MRPRRTPPPAGPPPLPTDRDRYRGARQTACRDRSLHRAGTCAVHTAFSGGCDLSDRRGPRVPGDRKSTRLNSSHVKISYAVFCLKKKKKILRITRKTTTIASRIISSE